MDKCANDRTDYNIRMKLKIMKTYFPLVIDKKEALAMKTFGRLVMSSDQQDAIS